MEIRKKNSFSLKRRLLSFRHAGHGIYHCFLEEHNIWIHTLITVVVILAGILFDISGSEWCLVVLSIGFVFTAEIINTAIEILVDLVSPEYNPMAGLIKDTSAGTVLIAAITAAVVGLIIFVPKIIAYFA